MSSGKLVVLSSMRQFIMKQIMEKGMYEHFFSTVWIIVSEDIYFPPVA